MSPRTKAQNEEIRKARMRQIRAAAADVYLSRGMAFEIRDVAARAGIGYGTVYHYFNNKYLLLDDLLQHALDAASALTQGILGRGGDAPGRLRELAAGLLRLWTEERTVYILYKMAAENFHQLPRETALGLSERFETELYDPIADAIRASSMGRDVERTANVLIGSLVGSAGLWLYHGRPEPDAEALTELLFAGIAGTTTSREERDAAW